MKRLEGHNVYRSRKDSAYVLRMSDGKKEDVGWKSERCHGCHMDIIWISYGYHILVIWMSYRCHIDVIWMSNGCHMDFIWMSY